MKRHLFLNLLKTDLKRTKKYFIPVISAIIIILLICGSAALLISSNLYKEQTASTFKLAYYLPDDSDKKNNSVVANMIGRTNSMNEIVTLIEVSDLEDGYELIKKGEVLYYIIVPEGFFTGIMTGDNKPLDIVVRDNSGINSYIANELFLSYADYLGTAQAAIYSMLDTVREDELSDSEIDFLQNKVNLIFLDRALNKDEYLDEKEATMEGSYTLTEHYLASALMISLFFMAFVIMPLLTGHGKGVMLRLRCSKINSLHIFLSNYLDTLLLLYIAYLPCYAGISIYSRHLNLTGLFTIIPTIMIIGAIICIVTQLCNGNIFAANITLLLVTIIIAYVGGGILPHAMLPTAITELSGIMPGSTLIENIAFSLFGRM